MDDTHMGLVEAITATTVRLREQLEIVSGLMSRDLAKVTTDPTSREPRGSTRSSNQHHSAFCWLVCEGLARSFPHLRFTTRHGTPASSTDAPSEHYWLSCES